MNRTTSSLDTYFASPKRATSEELAQQRKYLTDRPLVRQLIEATSEVMLIVNPHRQIVMANRALCRLLEIDTDQEMVGKRPGEALTCVHEDEMPGGCGTAEACRTCGAAKSLVTGLKLDENTSECRLTRRSDGGLQAMDFSVLTSQLSLNGVEFFIFTMKDISDQKRRRVLERLFFHDIMNTAGGLHGFMEMLREDPGLAQDSLMDMLCETTDTLIGEIEGQKQLMAAEAKELTLNPSVLSSCVTLQSVAKRYARLAEEKGRKVTVDSQCQDVAFTSDLALLSRVLGNLVKNAVEAVPKGSSVTMGCSSRNGSGVRFWVHNPNAMERKVQLQVFNRSFSTKGTGRGLGTYSVKLLGEGYLGGKVSFISNPEDGTTFSIQLPKTPPS